MDLINNKIDLHIHTTISDGTDTPGEILSHVKSAGLSVFSVTDHDAVSAADTIRHLTIGESIRFIPGVEFSCRDEIGKYHILGYGFDSESISLKRLVEKGHSFRMKKLSVRLDRIRSEYGFTFTKEETDSLYSMSNPGKPHIAALMVKKRYVSTKDEALEKYLNGISFTTEYVRPEEAIEAILSGGGIPVLAHPFFGSGNELILGKEMDDRIVRMKDFGLLGIEAFYSGFSEELRGMSLLLAKKHSLLITAGSDYHGKNKNIELGDTGLGNRDKCPDELLSFLDTIERHRNERTNLSGSITNNI